jgi:hypothetical protein
MTAKELIRKLHEDYELYDENSGKGLHIAKFRESFGRNQTMFILYFYERKSDIRVLDFKPVAGFEGVPMIDIVTFIKKTYPRKIV